MRCPNCDYYDSKVLETRSLRNNTNIRRRRQCLKCAAKFTTYERLEQNNLIRVVKSSGEKELFNREKLIRGISSAFERRNINLKVIETLAEDIERDIIHTTSREISSKYIGKLVLNGLKEIDEVAYVRFASVYLKFKDISSFVDFLSSLDKEGITEEKELEVDTNEKRMEKI